MRGEEGAVAVTFAVARGGQILSVAITRSSGTPSLDDAVRRMLTSQRLPAFPPDMTQPEATLSVVVRFTLEP